MPHGVIEGDALGNIAVVAHVLLAIVITIGGPLQLCLGALITGKARVMRNPAIRRWTTSIHHWNGRIYIATAFVMSISGLYMVWSRGVVGGVGLSISINGILIMICAVMVVRYAMAGDIKTHLRWALRLFLVVSGVWFFRIGLMLWMHINKGPAGFDPQTFQGPFLTFLGFAQYLIPLAVLEVYFVAKDRAGARGKLAIAGGLFILTLATGVGIYMASMNMWLPRL